MKPWTCVRVTNGTRCGHVNASKKTMLCVACGKRRPPSKRPAHMAALDLPYEWWVEQFGTQCGICGGRPDGARLHRDHEHKGEGFARGLLCFQCNRKLGNKDARWVRLAADYLERAESRRAA